MNPTEDPNRVLIFDTTLRDGEQSPGISLNTQEKLEIAQQLARLGVDVLEAGFPITSPGDFEAVQAIARTVRGPVIAGLSRTQLADVDRCWDALRPAERARIHYRLHVVTAGNRLHGFHPRRARFGQQCSGLFNPLALRRFHGDQPFQQTGGGRQSGNHFADPVVREFHG